MAERTSRRRWFQFSVASLLLMITGIILSVYALTEHQRHVRLQAEAAAQNAVIQQLGVENSVLHNHVVVANQRLMLNQQQRIQAATEAEQRREQETAVPNAP